MDRADSGSGASQICHLLTYLDIYALTYSPGPTWGSSTDFILPLLTTGLPPISAVQRHYAKNKLLPFYIHYTRQTASAGTDS